MSSAEPNPVDMLVGFVDWIQKSSNINLVTASASKTVAEFLAWKANQAYGVWENSDKVEGRGVVRLTRIFRSEEVAKRWVEKQSDYPGHPSYRIKPIALNLSQLNEEDGWEVPR